MPQSLQLVWLHSAVVPRGSCESGLLGSRHSEPSIRSTSNPPSPGRDCATARPAPLALWIAGCYRTLLHPDSACRSPYSSFGSIQRSSLAALANLGCRGHGTPSRRSVPPQIHPRLVGTAPRRVRLHSLCQPLQRYANFHRHVCFSALLCKKKRRVDRHAAISVD